MSHNNSQPPNTHAQNQPVYIDKGYAQQPQATQGMSIVPGGGNRNVKNLPVDQDGREWSHGLFDCCDDAGTCILASYCPCIVYSQNKQRYEHLAERGAPDPEHGGGMCTGSCWVHGLITGFCGLGRILQVPTRGSIRSRYNIKGGGFGDCCTAWWCSPCELTQESRELELEEQSFGSYQH